MMTETEALTKPVILYVDDEANALKYFDRVIGSLGTVITASSVDEGMQRLDEHHESLRVLISDQRMPNRYGNELLAYALERYPRIVRILTTAHSELDDAVKAVNQGQIHRYIRKPWDVCQLRAELRQALEHAELVIERDMLLREKISVHRGQLLSQRIGSLRAIYQTASHATTESALDGYLGAAVAAAWSQDDSSTWLETDFTKLVADESSRCGLLGRAAVDILVQLRNRCSSLEDAVSQVASRSAGKLAVQNARLLMVNDGSILTEFLSDPTDVAVSNAHATWLAFLFWLDERGAAVSTKIEGDWAGIHIGDQGAAKGKNGLVDWMELFLERSLLPRVQKSTALRSLKPRSGD